MIIKSKDYFRKPEIQRSLSRSHTNATIANPDGSFIEGFVFWHEKLPIFASYINSDSIIVVNVSEYSMSVYENDNQDNCYFF